MNRVLLSVAALFGALMPLVFDSALKGASLLVVATLCALLLCRASAATRHLVWLVAVIALLAVPVLSVALPQWRVLPRWAVVRAKPVPSGEVRDRAVESYSRTSLARSSRLRCRRQSPPTCRCLPSRPHSPRFQPRLSRPILRARGANGLRRPGPLASRFSRCV